MSFIIAFLINQALSALDEASSVITTDPHPVGDANYLEVTFNVPVLFTELSSVQLTYKLQGSNDGQEWFDISSFTDNAASPTPTPKAKGGDVTCAFVRMHVELAGTGGTGISSTNFDLHANFTRK